MDDLIFIENVPVSRLFRIKLIALFVLDSLQSQHVAKLDMYSLLLIETTNDKPFSPPEAKYDKPF